MKLAEQTDLIASYRARSANNWDTVVETDFAQVAQAWLEEVAQFRDIAQKRLYDSTEEMTGDIVVHRLHLSRLILEAQEILIKYFGDNGTAKSEEMHLIETLEATVADLIDTLHAWHGSNDSQKDIPSSLTESLEQAFAGVDAGFDDQINARQEKN